MIALIPDMQPIRFYKPGATPDWLTYFPNMDNVVSRERWIEGYWNTEYFTDWLINKKISIQLRVQVEGTEDLILYKYDESTEAYAVYTTVSPVDISPAGWVSDKVNRYEYTPTETGIYYFDSASAGYRSEKFVVHQSLKLRRRLVQIAFFNSENDYGMVFFDGETSRYTGLAYFTGGVMPDAPGNDISAFETDRGSIEKLRSTPKKTAILMLTDIHYSEIARINMILSCDNLTINGISYQTQEAPEMSRKENTDLVNITAKLTQSNYNYFIS